MLIAEAFAIWLLIICAAVVLARLAGVGSRRHGAE
jgi:hypothetical protein